MLHPILGTLINLAIESFVSTHFGKPQDRAYPHVASLIPFFPVCILFGWQLPVNDDFFINEVKSATESLLQKIES